VTSAKERRRRIMVIVSAPLAYAAGFLSSLVLSLGFRGAGMSHMSAASLATAAGSSILSGSPCSVRERRASSAPAFRIASRSSSAMAGCRTEVALSVLVASFVPLPAFAGRSVMMTRPAGSRAGRLGDYAW
jgi:hypothetical protein